MQITNLAFKNISVYFFRQIIQRVKIIIKDQKNNPVNYSEKTFAKNKKSIHKSNVFYCILIKQVHRNHFYTFVRRILINRRFLLADKSKFKSVQITSSPN